MNVHIVADYMLSKGIKPNGELLSPLSIQKMLYFAQGWHLAIREDPLFFEEIRAWRHGPVIKDVYTRFRRYGERSIDASAMLSQPNAILSMPTRALIDEVWAMYGHYSAPSLVGLTHRDGPWKDARGDLAKDADSDLPISEDSMFTWFKREYQAALAPRDEPVTHDLTAEFDALRAA